MYKEEPPTSELVADVVLHGASVAARLAGILSVASWLVFWRAASGISDFAFQFLASSLMLLAFLTATNFAADQVVQVLDTAPRSPRRMVRYFGPRLPWLVAAVAITVAGTGFVHRVVPSLWLSWFTGFTAAMVVVATPRLVTTWWLQRRNLESLAKLRTNLLVAQLLLQPVLLLSFGTAYFWVAEALLIGASVAAVGLSFVLWRKRDVRRFLPAWGFLLLSAVMAIGAFGAVFDIH